MAAPHGIKNGQYKHGYSNFCNGKRNPTYEAWLSMWKRCTKPKRKDYKYYGGKGIKVCERWNKFINFLEDMGERPSKIHSIDRKDSDKDYEPSNCRWATKEEQAI